MYIDTQNFLQGFFDGLRNHEGGPVTETRSATADLHASGGKGRRLVGYAAVFDSMSKNLGGFREKISRGAFSRSISERADVRALLNHDPNVVLARTKSGTLKLSEDSTGLRCEILLPDTQTGKDLYSSVQRGDISEMSFGFRVPAGGDTWERVQGESIRTLTDVDLHDVSICTYPAYASTTISARQIRGEPMNSELKSLLQERAAIIYEQRKLLDAGQESSDQYQDLESAYQSVDAKIRQSEREDMLTRSYDEPIKMNPGAYNREQEFRRGGGDVESDPYQSIQLYRPGQFRKQFSLPQVSVQARKDFQLYLTRGLNFLPEAAKMRMAGISQTEVRRTLQADKDTVGGFLLAPERFGGAIVQDLHDLVFVRDLATNILEPYAQSVTWPVLDDTVDDSNWTSELKTGSEDSSMDFTKMALSPHPSAKRVKVSEKLVRSSGGLAESIVRSELVYKFGITEERAFLNGSGAGQPTGVFTAVSAGGLGITTSRDISTGNSTTEIKADNLIECTQTLKSQYRRNCTWIFSRSAVSQLRKLKLGDGSYIWQPGLTTGQPNMLLGFPVRESEYCPSTFTTGLYVGILGDFSYYFIVTALDVRIQTLTELYAETGEIGYIGRMEVDGAPIRESAFVRVRLA
jgi:HK97 family phage major capsid protein/HK97 family phage prohead protease